MSGKKYRSATQDKAMMHGQEISTRRHDFRSMNDQGLQLLILDDDEFDRQHICRLAGKLNVPVTPYLLKDLEAFKSALDERTFDLAIVDYRLPCGSGMDAARMARSHPLNAALPAIMIAGDAEIEFAVSAIRMGFVDYLPKDKLNQKTFSAAVANAMLSTLPSPAPLSGTVKTQSVFEGISKVCEKDMAPKMNRLRNDLIALCNAPEGSEVCFKQSISSSLTVCNDVYGDLHELSEYLACWTGVKH